MFKSFRVLLLFCVGFSVVQARHADYYETVIDDEYDNTEYQEYTFTTPTADMDCAPNEIIQCINTCNPDQTCRERDRGDRLTCLEEEQSCDYKCACEPGFYRNTENGVCITEKQCDKCNGPNEHFACGSPCDNTCYTLHLYNKSSCPGYNDSDCQPSCYCDDGYARDVRGICIPVQECTFVCGENEVMTECKKSSVDDTCAALNDPPTICDSEEQYGNFVAFNCVCKFGYFRIEENAPCLPICECPQKKGSLECLFSGKKLDYYLHKLLG